MMALALLSRKNMVAGFRICQIQAFLGLLVFTDNANLFERFFDYFERQWLKMVCGGIKNMYIF